MKNCLQTSWNCCPKALRLYWTISLDRWKGKTNRQSTHYILGGSFLNTWAYLYTVFSILSSCISLKTFFFNRTYLLQNRSSAEKWSEWIILTLFSCLLIPTQLYTQAGYRAPLVLEVWKTLAWAVGRAVIIFTVSPPQYEKNHVLFWCRQKQPRSQQRKGSGGIFRIPFGLQIWGKSSQGTFTSTNWNEVRKKDASCQVNAHLSVQEKHRARKHT